MLARHSLELVIWYCHWSHETVKRIGLLNWMFWFELDETGSCLLPQHWFSACSEKTEEFWGCCWLSPCEFCCSSSKIIITQPPALQLHSWVMTVFWCCCWWKLLLAVIFLRQNFARFWPQKFKRVSILSQIPCVSRKKFTKILRKCIYWESLATFAHSFNCQGSFFLTVFYKLANWCFFLLLEWLLMMLHKKNLEMKALIATAIYQNLQIEKIPKTNCNLILILFKANRIVLWGWKSRKKIIPFFYLIFLSNKKSKKFKKVQEKSPEFIFTCLLHLTVYDSWGRTLRGQLQPTRFLGPCCSSGKGREEEEDKKNLQQTKLDWLIDLCSAL
jgi:hypothetical protein